MNSYIRIATLALGTPVLALAALTVPAQADTSAEDIVVTSHADMQAWQADATRTLNRALERHPRQRGTSPGSGIVQLTFAMGADGKPANIAVRSNSANWTAVNTARHAVSRLGDLSDVPVTNRGEARFLANIIFANSREQYRELAEELRQSEAARLAAGGDESVYIALGG